MRIALTMLKHERLFPWTIPIPSPSRRQCRKDPSAWVSGDDPMTGAQASYLKTLSEQAHQPDAYDESISKAEASTRIDALKAKLDLE